MGKCYYIKLQLQFSFSEQSRHCSVNFQKKSILLFSSPELKAQVSYSDRLLSVVRLSVYLSVNFYIFDFFSKTTGPILTKIGTNHPLGEGLQVCSNERDCLSPRGDNSERVKMH
jgi:hypothetical protein